MFSKLARGSMQQCYYRNCMLCVQMEAGLGDPGCKELVPQEETKKVEKDTG